MFDKAMMMKKFEKKKKLSPNEKEAKMGVAQELSKQAGAMLGDKAKPKAKIEVAANSKEGLKHGLQEADALLRHSGGSDSVADHTGNSLKEGSPGEERDESPAEAEQESADAKEISEEEQQLSADEIDAKIKKLEELKASKSDSHKNPFA